MAELNVANLVAPCYDKVFWDIQNHNHTFYAFKGGRGSTKSSFISLMIGILLLQNQNIHVVIIRKYQSKLRDSVYNQMAWAVGELGISSLFKFYNSSVKMVCEKTKQQILFYGLDDPRKIKSIKVPFGYVGIVWFNLKTQATLNLLNSVEA